MDLLSVLWKGADYQDKLLQSYRNILLTIQSVFTCMGGGLTLAVIFSKTASDFFFTYGLLVVISAVGIYLLYISKNIIHARSEDVDYFHNQIIHFEKSLVNKNDQVLTKFKVYQKYHRKKEDINAFFQSFEVTDEIRQNLTEKGKGHTRKLLDYYLYLAFGGVWASFHIISLIKLLLICLK